MRRHLSINNKKEFVMVYHITASPIDVYLVLLFAGLIAVNIILTLIVRREMKTRDGERSQEIHKLRAYICKKDCITEERYHEITKRL